MGSEVVKYHNNFNKLGLRAFTANQLNLLMSICSRMKERNLEIVDFEFDYLKKLIKLDKNYTVDEFISEIISVNKKLLALNFMFETEDKIIQFALFNKFEIDKKNQNLKVSLNSEFSFLLNTLTSNFTRFELEEFVSFKSSYTKEFFRRMKQFRNSGFWEVSLEDFKCQLNVPTSYRITDIDAWVLKPIIKELKDNYRLKITKKYDKKGCGRPSVVGFKFTFLKEVVENKGYNEDWRLEYATNLELEEDNYKFRTIRLRDNKFDVVNFLKIIGVVKLENGKIEVKVKNVDDGYENKLYFDSLKIWDSFYNKYVV